MEPTFRDPSLSSSSSSSSSSSGIWHNWHIRSLMMMTKMILETSVKYRHLTRQIAREDFIIIYGSWPRCGCIWLQWIEFSTLIQCHLLGHSAPTFQILQEQARLQKPASSYIGKGTPSSHPHNMLSSRLHFSTRFSLWISFFVDVRYMPSPSQTPWIDHPNKSRWSKQTIMIVIAYSFALSYCLMYLRHKCSNHTDLAHLGVLKIHTHIRKCKNTTNDKEISDELTL